MNRDQKLQTTKPKLRLTYHDKQAAFLNCRSRFVVVPAGRRSGKTEIAKRRLVRKAISCGRDDGNFIACAPTHSQAKRIFWNDLKRYTEPIWISEEKRNSVSESELTIKLINGCTIRVMGLDKPERIEGQPVDGLVIDEIANVKEQAWQENISPALDTIGREGTCDFTGVPEGFGLFKDLYDFACADKTGDWSAFHWTSAEILPAKYIEAARRRMDEQTFRQEYEASFISFEGLAYYNFDAGQHVQDVEYNENEPLILCFDFNTSPGVAVIAQERDGYTDVIGEVYIPRHSNTPMVCRRLIDDWGDHKGLVHLYGDATGGVKKTSSVLGSDWDLIDNNLSGTFGGRIRDYVERSNPTERSRVNSMNSRLLTTSGDRWLRISPDCTELIKDFQNTTVVSGSGEIDKSNKKYSHITDALGYYVVSQHGLGSYGSELIQF